MNTYDRVEQLREKLRLNKAEVCDLLGIGRTMLHYLKTGDRHLSPKAYRRLEEEESKAGIRVILSPFDPPPEEVDIYAEESMNADFESIMFAIRTVREQLDMMEEKAKRLYGTWLKNRKGYE